MKPISLITACLITVTATAAENTIIRNLDRFELAHTMRLPEIQGAGTLWIPLAQTDSFQRLENVSIESPVSWRKTHDKEHQNELLVLHPSAADSGKRITVSYQVTRREKRAYTGTEDPGKHIKAEKLVPFDAKFVEIATKATQDAEDDLTRGKAIFTHVLDHMRYDKSGIGWGRGDALYACDTRTGNCTDFHAYFIGLCRAVNIPARFAIGLTIPADAEYGPIGGYHCWAEFYAEDKWVPVDISEADKHPDLAGYYFGHHPANRLELSRGRDILPNPSPAAGAFNYLFNPHLEIDGEQVPMKATFQFKRLPLKK